MFLTSFWDAGQMQILPLSDRSDGVWNSVTTRAQNKQIVRRRWNESQNLSTTDSPEDHNRKNIKDIYIYVYKAFGGTCSYFITKDKEYINCTVRALFSLSDAILSNWLYLKHFIRMKNNNLINELNSNFIINTRLILFVILIEAKGKKVSQQIWI